MPIDYEQAGIEQLNGGFAAPKSFRLGDRVQNLEEDGGYSGPIAPETNAIALAEGKVIVGNAEGTGEAVAVSGAISIAADGTTAIEADAVDEEAIQAGAVSVAKCSADVQDRIPSLTLSAVDAGDGTATLTIQAQDAAGSALAAPFVAEVWSGTADDYGYDALSAFTVTTGTQRGTLPADEAFRVVSDANGTIVLTLDNGGAGTRYAWAAIDGRVYASGAIAITAA